ncbi:hypothetical protein [Actinomadura macra]|uniref:hypothetical protein n=1 Tax=Actinomadura macra TaxID=46164 RepID=UPI00082AC7A1|nr:hypothetical protein [Actinomadura macra]
MNDQLNIVIIELLLVLLGTGVYAGFQLKSVNRHLAELRKPLIDYLSIATARAEREQRISDAVLGGTEGIAKTVVFSRIEVYPANPAYGEKGVGVFGIRNVGGEAVFVMGVTRDPDLAPARMAGGTVLAPADVVDQYLSLEPGDPELDVGQVALWYRDLSGRIWRRCGTDPHAVQMTITSPDPDPDPDPAPDPESAPESQSASDPEAVPEREAEPEAEREPVSQPDPASQPAPAPAPATDESGAS